MLVTCLVTVNKYLASNLRKKVFTWVHSSKAQMSQGHLHLKLLLGDFAACDFGG